MKMENCPIIVTGTGRSGTSSVARICRSLDISMGHRFRDPDDTNPEGFCEDLDFHEALVRLSTGESTEEQVKKSLWKLSVNRTRLGKPWGFKDTLVLDYPDLIAEVFPGAWYVVAERPREEVLDSLHRSLGMGREECIAMYDRRIEGRRALPEDRTVVVSWESLIGGTARSNIARHLDVACPPRILFSVPNMGWVHISCFQAMLGAAIRGGAAIDFDMPDGGEYTQKMNRFARSVVREGYDWWINMDDDNGPVLNPVDLIALDKPVIGLPTPIWKHDKEWPFSYSAFDRTANGQYLTRNPVGGEPLQEVHAVGSGCMVVRADVLRAIGLPAFQRVKDADGVKTTLGPDFYFCERVREAGFKIYAHFGYKCNHVKDVDLGTMFEKVGRLIMQPPSDVKVVQHEELLPAGEPGHD